MQEIGAAVGGGGLFAGAHFDLEHEAQIADEEGVVGVAGAAGLVGVVAQFRALLPAVDGFDRDVQVQHPGQAQGGEPGLLQRAGLPGGAGGGVHMGEGAADAVLAAHLGHAQARRVDGGGAQGGDVGVAVLAGEDGQGEGAQQVADEWGVGAGEAQGAGLDPVAKEAGGGEELAEEDELAQRGDVGVGIPFDMEATAVGVDRQR